MIMAGLEFDGRSYKPEQEIPDYDLPERVPLNMYISLESFGMQKEEKMSKSLGNFRPSRLDR